MHAKNSCSTVSQGRRSHRSWGVMTPAPLFEAKGDKANVENTKITTEKISASVSVSYKSNKELG